MKKIKRAFGAIFEFFSAAYYLAKPKVIIFLILGFWALAMSIFVVVSLEPFYFSDEIIKDIRRKIQGYKPPLTTVVYDDQSKKIMEFAREKRRYVKYEDIPRLSLLALIAAEDRNFFEHSGVDREGIFRAFATNIRSGSLKAGGSTITQQFVRNAYDLPLTKTFDRKIREAIIAFVEEGDKTKQEIAEAYVNEIYFGRRAYGLKVAADVYFAKDLGNLNLAENAFLAGLPQSPSRYAKNLDAAKKRMVYVLRQMLKNNYISKEEHDFALKTELVFAEEKSWQYTYFLDYLRQDMIENYSEEKLYTAGYKIFSSLNQGMQEQAERAVLRGLIEHDRRQGYRGAYDYVDSDEKFDEVMEKSFLEIELRPFKVGEIYNAFVGFVNKKESQAAVIFSEEVSGVIDERDVKWAFETTGLHVQEVVQVRLLGKLPNSNVWHVSLWQEPKAEAALVCVEAKTGQIKAMVGGLSYKKSQFNRATLARRQLGSAFKPILYGAALEKGYYPGSKFWDIKKCYDGYCPQNYRGVYSNKEYSLRQAMAFSINTIAVETMNLVGTHYVVDFAKRLGIKNLKKNDLTLALGSQEVPLIDALKAYTVFADKGMYKDFFSVKKILDTDGNVLKDNSKPTRKRVIGKSRTQAQKIAYNIQSMQRSVMNWGTGAKINPKGKYAIGKTGTTSNYHDAWFIGSLCQPVWRVPSVEEVYGDDVFFDFWLPEPDPVVKDYNAKYVVAVWVGRDAYKPLGKNESGSKAAGPIFKYFLENLN